MDLKALAYDQVMRKVAAEYAALNDANFTVSIQPGLQGLDMTQWSFALDYLSNLDCFHPTTYANKGTQLSTSAQVNTKPMLCLLG